MEILPSPKLAWENEERQENLNLQGCKKEIPSRIWLIPIHLWPVKRGVHTNGERNVFLMRLPQTM